MTSGLVALALDVRWRATTRIASDSHVARRLFEADSRLSRAPGAAHFAPPAVVEGEAVAGWTIPRAAGEWLSVIVGVEAHAVGTWLHTSVVGRTRKGAARLPSWAELVCVKELVHGNRLVVQVLPPREQWVNVVEALHLWERLDGPTLTSDVAP